MPVVEKTLPLGEVYDSPLQSVINSSSFIAAVLLITAD